MSTRQLDTSPITKSIVVDCGVERAFDVYANRMTEWWPLRTHSIHGPEAERVVMEGRDGGELYELSAGGQKAHWATITAWQPPHRLVLAWKVNPDAPAESEVEVRFTAEAENRTRVDVEHRDWQLLGEERGAEARSSYDEGWGPVLELYRAAAGA
ncbi:MAG: hypothetical protein QOJ31_2163 [Gaiellales bacterium]|jgi:uncharacterized protein YndB with AHSA1/START domain|nr:hypothetical protein [Gaiellales bacterium]MDX6551479.1 hypothetical protein [Gaiellales bacterium]